MTLHYFDEQIFILVRLLAAMLLGALIGMDREAAEKPAGLRTHMLVAGSAALLVMLGELLAGQLAGELGSQVVNADPIRIIAAIITGVSFLGAGTIIRQRSEGGVQGLTTAASLLFASVLGIAVALGQWVLAVGATLVALFILRVLPWIERGFKRRDTKVR
jgi:putative Mg2+ transporter-C (MgtC) family protein